jgi:DNA-binding MarR family transcriptional regulator
LQFVKVSTQIRYSRRVAPFGFLTNHGLALLCIAEDPRARMRDIAGSVDITERAAQRIVADLVEAGYIDRTREGRRNVYAVRTDLPIALAAQRDVDIGSLLKVLVPASASDERRMTVSGKAA